ncbi:hypothetical protein, partial [Bradyrhizobium sp. 179]|jgi:hypothetical protein|uniref:hypothetical protein n=1 Tax=Bradyrhizobium sp. 179 TaxID=2782648 RepID=UPI001FFBB707
MAKGSGDSLLVALARLKPEAVQLLFEGASAWLRLFVIVWHRALALPRLPTGVGRHSFALIRDGAQIVSIVGGEVRFGS